MMYGEKEVWHHAFLKPAMDISKRSHLGPDRFISGGKERIWHNGLQVWGASSRAEHGGKDIILCPCRYSNYDRPACNLIAILTELHRLIYGLIQLWISLLKYRHADHWVEDGQTFKPRVDKFSLPIQLYDFLTFPISSTCFHFVLLLIFWYYYMAKKNYGFRH